MGTNLRRKKTVILRGERLVISFLHINQTVGLSQQDAGHFVDFSSSPWLE
jgi:hypothetical protein